jgi:hypothetical protein
LETNLGIIVGECFTPRQRSSRSLEAEFVQMEELSGAEFIPQEWNRRINHGMKLENLLKRFADVAGRMQ